ncbi:MAG: sigma-70 family RNA polymerase sigma factor [Ruminococcaceae bacterium]|nr:sigma-70 family RNA polymerase sigma factor [Oscillospiraceae bacterium]
METILKELEKLCSRLKARISIISGKSYAEVYYINGPEDLPPPLDSVDEAFYLERLKSGNYDIDARNTLIEHNLRLVVFIAKKYDNTGIDPEDLISIGTIGLVKAITTFDTDKNIKLATYASKCIDNEILMYLRKSSSKRTEISIDEPLNVDRDGNELLLGDILGTDGEEVSSNIERDEENMIIHNAVERLSGRDKTIITMRFGLDGKDEMTQKEVADTLGISQSYISRLEKRIIEKLKKEIIK